MSNYKVSVIIPVYNGYKYINECLKSVTSQIYNNLEIFIINDGSTDDSYTLLKEWSKIDSRIILFNNTNHGVSYSRNFAIENCTGEYLVFIDVDDIVHKNFINKLVNLIIKEDVDCAACNITSFKEQKDDNFPISKNQTIIYNREEALHAFFGPLHGYMANKIYKKDIIIDNKLKLNEKIAISEDLLFNCEYIKHCKSFAYNTEILYLYRQSENSAFNNFYNTHWFSILDAYSLLANNCFAMKSAETIILSNYLLLIEQAKYRKRLLLNNGILSPNLEQHEEFVYKNIHKISLKTIIKLVLFRIAPHIVMWYKRRNL